MEPGVSLCLIRTMYRICPNTFLYILNRYDACNWLRNVVQHSSVVTPYLS